VPLLSVVLVALSACGAASPGASGTQVEQIGAADLQSRLAAAPAPFVLDVRTPQEYAQDGHIAGSVLIPLQELDQRLGELPKDQAIVCVCRSGNRSAQACDLLARQGFTQLSNMQGGMNAWKQAGYPYE
jgi:rhodanese-related sulfurtransferase